VNTREPQLWRGTTGRDGVAMAPALPLREPDDWYRMSFIVIAEKNGDVAYVASDWNEGISPWDFGHPYQLWESTDILRGSIFTDRGVYKPGEEVHVKAIVRARHAHGHPVDAGRDDARRQGARQSRPRGGQAHHHAQSLEQRRVGLDRAADATLGNYSLQVMMPGLERPEGNDVTPVRRRQADWLKRVSGSFLVAAYRRPDFRVDATLRSDTPVAGATLAGSVTRGISSASAMRERPVTWSITRSLTMEVPDAILEKYPEDRYAFGYYPENRDRGEDRIAGAEAKTDVDGARDRDGAGVARRRRRVPLSARRRRRRRLTSAHRQPRERAGASGALVHRPAAPAYFADASMARAWTSSPSTSTASRPRTFR
jgi:hypothetical protein